VSQPSVVTTSAPTPALWEDFIDIIVAPASVFQRRQRSSWIVPLIIVTLAIGIIAFASRGVLQPLMDAEFERAADQMRKNPQVTEDMIAKTRGFFEFSRTFGAIIFTPFVIVIVGFMTWLVAKFVDSKQTLGAALVVAAYSYVPRIIQTILNAVQGLVMKPDQLNSFFRLSFSPARFLDPDVASPVTLQLLSRFDVFTIWETVLLAIGVYVTGRVSKRQAVIAGILFWVVGTIPTLLSAMRQAATP